MPYQRERQALVTAAVIYGRMLDRYGEDPAGVDAEAALKEAALAYYDARFKQEDS